MNNKIEIRTIQKKDNDSLSKIIKSTLEEFNAAIDGTAYTDSETDAMFEAYTKDKSIYYVALLDNKIVAGCGINPLQNGEKEICELQKMYMALNARGKKIGKNLLFKCLDFAKKAGYQQIYLETFPNMTSAIALYKKTGFYNIYHSLGNTCHYSCNVWMLKDL